MHVINKEYLHLEEQIQTLNDKWSKELELVTLTNEGQFASIHNFPALPQLELTINVLQYRTYITELFDLLKEFQPALQKPLTQLESILDDEILVQWTKEAVSVNQFYFEEFASKHQIPEWLPMFVAEHAVRPFLQKATKEISPLLQKAQPHGGCPSCGEPPRIAVVSKKGTKEISCPRCLHTWEEKKISCAYCGNTEHGQIEILKIEKDDRSEIHVCHKCKGYTKVIDTRKLIKQDAPQLLDIKSIHLDYIAQENDFGIPEIKNVH